MLLSVSLSISLSGFVAAEADGVLASIVFPVGLNKVFRSRDFSSFANVALSLKDLFGNSRALSACKKVKL